MPAPCWAGAPAAGMGGGGMMGRGLDAYRSAPVAVVRARLIPYALGAFSKTCLYFKQAAPARAPCQPMEFPMLPLLAASAASSAIDKLTDGADSLWKKVSGKSGGTGVNDPASFASLLSGARCGYGQSRQIQDQRRCGCPAKPASQRRAQPNSLVYAAPLLRFRYCRP